MKSTDLLFSQLPVYSSVPVKWVQILGLRLLYSETPLERQKRQVQEKTCNLVFANKWIKLTAQNNLFKIFFFFPNGNILSSLQKLHCPLPFCGVMMMKVLPVEDRSLRSGVGPCQVTFPAEMSSK